MMTNNRFSFPLLLAALFFLQHEHAVQLLAPRVFFAARRQHHQEAVLKVLKVLKVLLETPETRAPPFEVLIAALPLHAEQQRYLNLICVLKIQSPLELDESHDAAISRALVVRRTHSHVTWSLLLLIVKQDTVLPM